MGKPVRTFYVDGACNTKTKVGGWASIELVFENDETNFYSSIESGAKQNTTNNEMELIAAYNSVLKAFKEDAREVRIFTDSAYVCNAVSKNWLLNWAKTGWITSTGSEVKNKEIWRKLHRLVYQKEIIVRMVLVKGHVGDPLNELADKVAVEARINLEKELENK